MSDPPIEREGVPTTLLESVRRDLAPVAPLAMPRQRALWLALPSLFSLGIAALLLADRKSLPATLSPAELGVSSLEWLAGLCLLWLALREAVPALGIGRTRCIMAVAGGIALQLGLGIWVWQGARVGLTGPNALADGMKCSSVEGLIGLPHIAIAVWLALRALPLRPGCSGALSGAAAGLLSDAVWHLACGRNDLEHLLLWHLGAVVVMTLAGAAAGSLWSWRGRPRKSATRK